MYHLKVHDERLNPYTVCHAGAIEGGIAYDFENMDTCQLIFREFRDRENGDKVIPASEVCHVCLNIMENNIEKNIRGLKRNLENLRIARYENV